MLVISDLPPFVIDQIVSTSDTSYVVVRLWLCGNKRFNDKLSKGITLIDLKSHRYFRGRFPRIISQLHSLCHLSLHTTDNVYKLHGNWPDFVRIFPNTLETLSIGCDHHSTFWNIDGNGEYIKTTFTRGESHAIEFETLFPRLHTLTLGGKYDASAVPTELFPALPASLTCLDARIVLTYKAPNDSFLHLLPPGIVHLPHPIDWNMQLPNENAGFMDVARRDFANASKSLQTFTLGDNFPFCEETDPSFLPPSILEIDFNNCYCYPPWTPLLARTMPPNLHTLGLGRVDSDSFAFTHTNWVADLPRTLTKLTVEVPSLKYRVDFPSYGRHLPPNLTHLTLLCFLKSVSGVFGDWNTIAGADYWPSNLTKVVVFSFWMEPSAIANLPPTLKELHLNVSLAELPEHPPRIKFESKHFPPNLTLLNLQWTKFDLQFSLSELPLETCIFTHAAVNDAYPVPTVFPTASLMDLPTSLTKLQLSYISVRTDFWCSTSDLPDELLPNLKYFEADEISQACLTRLPRQLLKLKVRSLYSADGQPFKYLPPTLKSLEVLHKLPKCELLDQDFGTLSSLTALRLPEVTTSKIFRLLSRQLTSLCLHSISEWTPSDVAFFPPHLKEFRITEWTAELAECVSLRCLTSLHSREPPTAIHQIAKDRVLQAAKHQ